MASVLHQEFRRAHLRSLARDKDLLRQFYELTESQTPGWPNHLFAPFAEIIGSEPFQALTRQDGCRLAIDTATRAGLSAFPEYKLSPICRETLTCIDELLEILPERHRPNGLTQPPCAPDIDYFETYEDGLDMGEHRAGQKIDEACPGTFLRIVGSGFAKSPAENAVRFDRTLAPVLEATSEWLVVIVPVPRVRKEGDAVDFDKGRVRVTINTVDGGEASTDFIIADFEDIPEGGFESAIAGLERILAKYNHHLAIHGPILHQYLGDLDTVATSRLINTFPILAAEAARSLRMLPESLRAVDEQVPGLSRLVDGMMYASRATEEIERLENEIDDPSSMLLGGSGWIEWVCKVAKFIEKWILRIIIAFVLVVIAIILFFILLGPFGIAIAIGIIVVMIAFWKIIAAVIAVLLLIRLVVSIVYRVLRDLYDLWEWLTSPSPASLETQGG